MKPLNKSSIRDLLTEAIKFSNGIDKYVRFLGIDAREVALFKNDVELLRFIIERDNSFTESFISYNTVSIQWRLTELIVHCTASENYNNEIGDDLGIKIPLSDTLGLNSSMPLNWGMDMADPQSFLY